MNRHSRLSHLGSIHKETYSEKDERDTQKLTHVKDHILLEINLGFLDEFYEEPHPETNNEEDPYERASVDTVEFLHIQPKKEQAEDQIAERFVQLSRMFGLCLTSETEHESPRKSCDISVYLGIEKVAESDECRSKCHGDA